eukprot:7053015-Alexandrium_andersonii.AAC.1
MSASACACLRSLQSAALRRSQSWGGPANLPARAATIAAAQPAAAGHRGAERTAHVAPRPGRREAGSPPERGNARR